MIEKVKRLITRNKTVFANFSYLSLLQIFNILLPLATYPYLLRILGAELYGKIIFAQTIMLYFSIVINFGFNISATKDISVSRKDLNVVSKIVSSVYSIKLALWVFSFFLLALLLFFIPSMKEDYLLYLFTFGITFNELLFPQWYFQGIEKMKYITIINLVTRGMFVLLIFIGIKSIDDYLLVPIFNSLGAIIAGLISVFVLIRIHKISFSIQKYHVLKSYFLDSFPLFISRASIQVYSNISKVMVGVFLGMTEVAYFDLGQKMLNVLKMPLSILSQALYPKFSRDKNIPALNQIMLGVMIFTVAVYTMLNIYSDKIVYLIGGYEMQKAILVVKILLLSFIFVGISQFLGSLRLIPYGYKNEYLKTTVFSVAYYFLILGLLALFNCVNIISLSIITVSVDFVVIVFLVYFNYKRGILK